MEIFSARLKWLREKAGLTQKQVAEQVGMSPQGYGKIENGDRDPNLEVLAYLPSILGESVDFMIGVTGDTKETQEIKSDIERFTSIIEYGEEKLLNPKPNDRKEVVSEIIAHNLERRAEAELLLNIISSDIPYYDSKPTRPKRRAMAFPARKQTEE